MGPHESFIVIVVWIDTGNHPTTHTFQTNVRLSLVVWKAKRCIAAFEVSKYQSG